MGALRPRQRKPEPAGLRRPHQRRRRSGPADFIAPVEQRLPSRPLAGRRVPIRRRSGSLRAHAARQHLRFPEKPDPNRQPAQLAQLAENPRPGNRHPHRAVRTRLPHAGLRARTDGPIRTNPRRPSNSTAARRATAPSPPTACSPAASPSAAPVSSSSITAAGTTTAASRMASPPPRNWWTRGPPPCSPTSSSAAC